MKEYKFKINGNEYVVAVNGIADGVADVTVNGVGYNVELADGFASPGTAAPAPAAHVDAVDQPGTLAAPMSGTALAMSDAPDAVFASLKMGNGVVIEPQDGAIYSPVTGTVTMLFDTKHAIGLQGDDGAEILIHIGVDTVELGGAPFTSHCASGDKVKAGDLLMEVDLDALEAADKPSATMVIITNSDDFAAIKPEVGPIKAGQASCTLTK